MVWQVGDPWPGSAGGAARDEWSGYIRIFLQAQIAGGTPFTMGDTTSDRLNGGNVMVEAGGLRVGSQSSLWVDITPDLTDLEINLGSSAGAGVLSQSEAGTLTATLYDPEGKYDPLNGTTRYALNGQTRLTPGVPIRCWAEVVYNLASTPPPVYTFGLFSGTADRWSHDWKQEPSDRFAKLVATDPTKQFARFDKPALANPIGAGETTVQRLARILTYYGWQWTVSYYGTPAATLQGTTHSQTAWEQIGRAATDELGFAYFRPPLPAEDPFYLTLITRQVWNERPAPKIQIGCGAGLYDIATEAVPASFDAQLRNAAYVSRTGGTQQTAQSLSSIERFWEQSVNRSDLGLNDDAQAGQWASAIVALSSYPQTSIDKLTLRPDLGVVGLYPFNVWHDVLSVRLIQHVVRVLWQTGGYDVDVLVRVVGLTHKITTDEWNVEWRTVSASIASQGVAFTMGPDPQDVLDAGFVMA